MQTQFPKWLIVVLALLLGGILFVVIVGSVTGVEPTKTETSEFKQGVPEEIVGEYNCEVKASDGETDTGFYALRIEKDGEFSLYDTTGNPGIAGKFGVWQKRDALGNYHNKTKDGYLSAVFDDDDFDPPFCWEKLLASGDDLQYEYKDNVLKLGYNDVWLIFHKI